MSQVLITGGAGFIGTNVARHFAEQGHKVIVFDNLSRSGVEQNLVWLQQSYLSAIEFEPGDIRHPIEVDRAVRKADLVLHFAAQTAVTTSLANPREDFEVNVGGTLNVLEAIRKSPNKPPLIFTSTNKVYGSLNDITLRANGTRYEPPVGQQQGVSETQPLDFHSPYGCSKGAADQYVLDYARSFQLLALVFRMSCIYGPHQMGTEDQGWIAHFLRSTIEEEPVVLCGDGMQVRDALFVDDLVEAFVHAYSQIEALAGSAFNMGGGPDNTISLLELLNVIKRLTGRKCRYTVTDWRAGDQRYYVSDTRRFQAATGWRPQVSVEAGLEKLYEWSMKTPSSSFAGGRSANNGHALLTR